jgi:hypothetical protein
LSRKPLTSASNAENTWSSRSNVVRDDLGPESAEKIARAASVFSGLDVIRTDR